ncbi:hypothetical protein [Flavobacterium wongokense]|uniref:hypothetical protein n=1 Tax=Flavobacterium wongokense TaxID=2910674 RepID=UPI001F1749CA|nr:hypothetical protein [Flavobacterium sp. WG47]MCF6132744.1 hypothetical protein [Flavobacterium sp. WG47]
MSVNFFLGKCQDNRSERIFGLRDREGKRPAYVDNVTANRKLWTATVVNKQRYNVRFVAIDFCVPFPRVEGKKVKRCDCGIFYNSTVTFIELKERGNKRKWLTDGDAQLRNTIDAFKATDLAADYPVKRAYIANKKQPRFNKAHTRRMDEFYDKTGYVLRIQSSIILE